MMGKTTSAPASSTPSMSGPVIDPLNTNPYPLYQPGAGLSPKVMRSLGKFRTGTRALRNLRFSHDLEGNLLNENRNKILREVKHHYILPEEKKEKIKYRPKVIGAPPRSVGSDMMKQAECPTSFKPIEEKVWGKNERYRNARASQERKNQVLDFVGTSDHAWEWITETIRKKGKTNTYENFNLKELDDGEILYSLTDTKGKKEYLLQSEINDTIFKSYFGKYFEEQQTLNAPNDPLIKRIRSKLATQIDYPDKPSPMGFPNNMPPEMVNGFHPDYGKRSDYYSSLDPKSADAMPATGDPETDEKVASQKTPLLSRLNKIRKK
jgi:hypothetical protein